MPRIEIELPPIDYAIREEFEKGMREEAGNDGFLTQTVASLVGRYGPGSSIAISVESHLARLASEALSMVASLTEAGMIAQFADQESADHQRQLRMAFSVRLGTFSNTVPLVMDTFDSIMKNHTPALVMPRDAPIQAGINDEQTEATLGAALRSEWFEACIKHTGLFFARMTAVGEVAVESEKSLERLTRAGLKDRFEAVTWAGMADKGSTLSKYSQAIADLGYEIANAALQAAGAIRQGVSPSAYLATERLTLQIPKLVLALSTQTSIMVSLARAPYIPGIISLN